jgi:acetyltransferase
VPTARDAALGRLLDPRSVAVVGASPAPEKAGHQALLSLARFAGEVFAIHPSAGEILGRHAFPSLVAAREATGIAPDLAILAIPAAATVAAVRDAAAAGCGGVLIISGGFGESGDAGLALQEQLLHAARAGGVRVLGPNTSGFLRPATGCAASFAPGVDRLEAGPVAVVAQSGGVNLALTFHLEALGIGISVAVGLGNAIDVDAADVLARIADDPSTRAIVLHLEGVRDGRRLYETLRAITPRKPVVVVTPGRADIGAFAQSHTGNLIGGYARKLTALRQAGVVIADTSEGAVDAVVALACARVVPRATPGVAIVTGQAGPGLLMADALKSAGVMLPTLTGDTATRLRGLLPPLTYLDNPVDTGRPGPSFGAVLATVEADAQIDATLLFTLHEPAAVDPVALTVARASRKPLAFGTGGVSALIAPTLAALRRAGVPAYPSPERAAIAVRAWCEDAQAQARLARDVAAPAQAAAPVVLPMTEAQGKALLASYGIAVPRGTTCATRDEAMAAFAALAKPLAVKLSSAVLTHKTEAGAVRLGIASSEAMHAALDALDRIPLSGARAYLVEEMAPPGVELIVGGVRDPSFGPLVMVGLGGVTAEAMQDTALRLAPATLEEAHDMLRELRGQVLLEGFRGLPRVDRDAVARVLVAVGRLMAEHPEIAELDVNPLRCYAGGVLALDALVVGVTT